MQIGAQLYTVREFCKTLEDFSETLKKVAEIGYKTVQVSGTCGYEPMWLKEELDKNGLSCVLTHIPSARLTDEAEKAAEEHSVFSCSLIGLGYYKFDGTEEKYAEFVSKYRPVAERIAKSGKYFMYHNHASEFIHRNGKPTIYSLAEDIAPEFMGFTLDTYWAQVAGADPAYVIERLANRVPAIHLKDCAVGPKMAAVGEGNINFDRVFAAAEKAGTKYMLAEQDDCGGEDPFVCLKRSYEFLVSRGFN